MPLIADMIFFFSLGSCALVSQEPRMTFFNVYCSKHKILKQWALQSWGIKRNFKDYLLPWFFRQRNSGLERLSHLASYKCVDIHMHISDLFLEHCMFQNWEPGHISCVTLWNHFLLLRFQVVYLYVVLEN